MFGLGPREIIILAVILVLLFGAKKIPELARSIGEAMRHIKNGFSDEKDKTDEKNENAYPPFSSLSPLTNGASLIKKVDLAY